MLMLEMNLVLTEVCMYQRLKEEFGEAVSLLGIFTLQNKGEHSTIDRYIHFDKKEMESRTLQGKKMASKSFLYSA